MKISKLVITLVGVAVALLAAHTTFARGSKHYNLDNTKIDLGGCSPVSNLKDQQTNTFFVAHAS